MTLKETYDIWVVYYFPSRTNSMRYKLNICMNLLRPLHNMEMDDIDEVSKKEFVSHIKRFLK